MKNMISYAGELIEIKEEDGEKKYILKPSAKSNVLFIIPFQEISDIYTMEGVDLI